jgi:rhodanese-related sulfurtransferase
MSYTKTILTILLLLTVIPIGSAGCSAPASNDDIDTQAANQMIQSNKDNPNFVLVDVRRKDEFDGEHLAAAVNIDKRLPDFEDTINEQDKKKEYVVYCRTGIRGGEAQDIMKELRFRKVYNLLGGINQWKADGFPVVKPVVNENITVEAVNYMIQGNEGKTDFVVVDVRRKDEFDAGHIANAVNIDFTKSDFKDRIGKQDRNNKYVVYCRSGSRSSKAANTMNGLGFRQVYNIIGGYNQWKADNLPIDRSVVNEFIDTQTAFYILKNNRTNPDLVCIDVRTKTEYDAAHPAIAINIDVNAPDFWDKIGRLDRTKKYVVYCQDGTRSKQALQVMKDYEFWQVYGIEGGLTRWLADGLPLDYAPGDTSAAPASFYLALR